MHRNRRRNRNLFSRRFFHLFHCFRRALFLIWGRLFFRLLFLRCAVRSGRGFQRVLHLFRRPYLRMRRDHAVVMPFSAVNRNPLLLLKPFQHTLVRDFIEILQKLSCLFFHALSEFLPALLFILTLHRFPFAHDVVDIHLAGDLLFSGMFFRHHHADLAVILLGKIVVIIRLRMADILGDSGAFLYRNIFRLCRGTSLLLFCRNSLLFCRNSRLFCRDSLLFCMDSLLFRLALLHQLLHARRQLFLQVDSIVFPNIHGLHLDVHILTARPRFFLNGLIRILFLQFLRDPQSLPAHHVGVKFFLLGGRKRLMKRFQLHGLYHVFSFPKPQDQFVAFFHAFGRKSHPMIQIRKLIGPFFPVVLLLQLLKDSDPFLQPHILRFIELILKDISPAVIGRDLYEILIIFDRMDHIAHPDRQIAERIDDHPAGRMTFIRHLQQKLRILKSPVHLVYIADRAEHHHTLHSCPVDRIRNLCCFRIFFLGNQRFYFLSPYLIFIFIQGCHLCRKLICGQAEPAHYIF